MALAGDGLAAEIVDRFRHRVGMAGEHMIGPADHAVIDMNVFLRVELVHQLANRRFGNQFVHIAVQHEATAWARGEEPEIVVVRGRRNADPAGNLWPAHQKLHADERTERVTGDPKPAMTGIDRLHPVQRRGGIADFADSAVVTALTASDTAEVESHHGASKLLKCLVHRIGDAVIHRPAMQRMRVQNQGDRRAGFLRMVITTF